MEQVASENQAAGAEGQSCDPTQTPIFLVGCVRSGTTLLRLMLDHHPQLAFLSEFELAVDLVGDDGSFPDMEGFRTHLQNDRIFNLYDLDIDPALGYTDLLKSFLRQKLERDEKQIVGATVHHAFDRLPALWPNAKFIHIVRDPRDVGRSIIQMGWAGNLWTGVERWIDAELTWRRLSEQLPAERRYEVRSEDLICEHRATLEGLCEFIGVPFDERIYDYADNSTYSLPDPKLTQQWRRKLEPEEIQLAEARTREMLLERGYELSGQPALDVSPAMVRRLKRQDWWYRARFRMKRFGLPLFALDYVARKAHIKPLEDYTRRRMHATVNAHMK